MKPTTESSHWTGRIVTAFAAGALVSLVLALYADLPNVLAQLSTFEWSVLPVVLLLTLSNYLVRYLKFRLFLARLGYQVLPVGSTLMIYFAGLAMVVTPGKVGEWVKSYLLRAQHNIPIERTIPLVLAERISDAIAMALIALLGLLVVEGSWLPSVSAFVLLAGALAFFRVPWFRNLVFVIGRRTPFLTRRIPALEQFFASGASLLSVQTFGGAVVLSVIAWTAECLGYGLILGASGLTLSLPVLGQAAFIFATSILAGAVLLVPGGLGVAEGGMTGLTQVIFGFSPAQAAATTILARLGTIWFGVALGIVALLAISRSAGRPANESIDRASAESGNAAAT